MSNPLKCDLAVIGGGLAGLAAAVRATELGGRVIVLEQGEDERYACNSRFAGGIFHVAYHDAKLDRAVLEQAINVGTQGGAQSDLATAIATDAGRAIDWVRAQGGRFVRGAIHWHAWIAAPPRPPTTGMDWQGRGADVLLRTLTERLVAQKGAVLGGTRATSLIMRAGKCCGVAAERAGATIEIESSAVIVADGGFQGSAALFKQHIGPRPDLVLQRGAGTARGDGLTMAVQAGAAVTALNRFYGHLLSLDALHNDNLWPYPQIDAVAAAAIVVDRTGRRFLDEGPGGIYMANELAAHADPTCGTVILDAPLWERAGREAQIPPNPLLEKAGGTLYRADTLAQLANIAGLPADALTKTVADYNAALGTGTTQALLPRRSIGKAQALPIREPPFFAIPLCTGITYTMGGIAIDGRGRVRRDDGTIIDGLYAAGSATGGLEGGAQVGYVGGLIKALVQGIRAAEAIAERVLR